MDSVLLLVHSLLRWLILLFALVIIVTAAGGLGGKKPFTAANRKTALFLLISVDLQLLVGLILYFLKGYYRNFSGGAMKEVMQNAAARYWTVEHITGMIIAIILVHVGYAGIKGDKADKAKFSRLFWCVLVAAIVVAAVMPWPFREAGIARPWLHMMD